jgi:A/G-specific adenine glycosylase
MKGASILRMPLPTPDWHALLVPWFRAARRDLPWRRTRDPYRVWISEAMLQQTRVEAVVGHYERFVARFPTVEVLAAAGVEAVLEAWSGLGYYSRARSLHGTAREVVARHGGVFPRTAAELEALRGIGPYTAGAVASIAHGTGDALVDGNVERVFARWMEWPLARGSAELRRRSWALARELAPRVDAGEWNQALMELGALVCTPRLPKCDACPVRAPCKARAAGRAAALPLPKPKSATIEVELVLHLVEEGGRVLVRRRASVGRMASLVEFPTTEERPGGVLWPARPELEFAEDEELARFGHAITHHRIRARVVRARLAGALQAPRDDGAWSWMTPVEVRRSALTGMARKLVARCLR